MTVLRQRVDTAKATFDERTQREQRLSQQIEQLQASTAATDLATQDQIRDLLDLRGRVSRDRMQTALPAWQQAARNLDAVVRDYNANCLKPMYRTDIEQAQANLMCPPVP